MNTGPARIERFLLSTLNFTGNPTGQTRMPRRPSMPVATPELPEHIITQPAQLEWCLQHLSTASAVGFDTEFVGEDAYRPELCLIQVATADQIFVIDPLSIGSLEGFWRLLLDPKRVTVVHAGREDIRLCYFQVGKPPANLFDLQLAAGLVGLAYPIGYGGLIQALLGQRMTKGETLTDWRRRPLLPAQLRYAFDDVRYLLPAWKKLTDRLKRLKRMQWAQEEFANLVFKSVGDEESEAERWRRVKGIGGLDRRGLAIARELFTWREHFAARINRPARHLLRDDVLAELSRRGPSKSEELSSYRSVPRAELEAILEAIRKAKSLPIEQCPDPENRDNDPPAIVMLGNLLGVVLADWCAKNKLAPNLVASSSDLRAIVRSRVYREQPPELPLTRGWRASAILFELESILNGSKLLRVVNPGATSPLEVVPFLPPDNPDIQKTLSGSPTVQTSQPTPPKDPKS
jgi:ribonuclease D